jgi:hypothetical protein
LPDGALIVYDQNLRLAEPPGCPYRRKWLLIRYGQMDGECGTDSGGADDPQRAAVAPNDTHYGGKTEPAAGEFRREKRVEDLRLHRVIHAAAVIADFEANVDARRRRVADIGFRQIVL